MYQYHNHPTYGDKFVAVNYTEFGSLELSDYEDGTIFGIYLDRSDHRTLMTVLSYKGERLTHLQNYVSAMEFATVEMKQILTIYVKRKVCMLDDEYYTLDDPKLHGFISKLSYEGIKYVAEHVVEFAKAFKENKVSELLNIPKPSRKHRS
ncbi:MAG: hypothetical protein JHC33_04855 [Ignisphaera sp.]|nr:hypothetical protein [Ignisphaera sp.]